jgi:predicted small lipoprotein YifL
MRPAHLACASLLAAVTMLAGCGAKTGLDVPDANVDAARPIDAGVDVGPHDAGRDAGSDASIPCVLLEPDAGPIELPLDTQVTLGRADVVFLIDVTGSMSQEIGHIQAELRDTIAPGIQAAIPDAQLGVATFADFPVEDCGTGEDRAYNLVLPVTSDLARVQAAVNGIGVSNGGDPPEAQVEALFQTATGAGLGDFIAPSFGCPAGGFGYACFRNDALPVILLFTDDLWHDGPANADPFSIACPELLRSVTPHPYSAAVSVLQSRGVRVMGLFSGLDGTARAEMDRVATDTSAVDASNRPLVFDIGVHGDALSSSVISAITTLSNVIRFDIDTVLVDPIPGDGVDPRMFVQAVTPIRAEPMDGVESIDVAAGTFRQVRTGTRVVFQLTLRNGSIAPGAGPQVFPLEIVFRGDRRTRVGSTTIDIVIPGIDGSGCPR